MIVDVALYEHGGRVADELSLPEMVARGRRDPNAFVWIGLFEPTDEEFDEVEVLFDLHPLAVEDAVHAHQRPKLERYGDVAFLVMKTVGFAPDGDDLLDTGEVMVFLGDGFVVTVRHGQFTGLTELRRRLEADGQALRGGPGTVLHAVADRVVDAYEDAIEDLEEEVEQIEEAVFAPGRHDLTSRIYRAKREAQTVRRAVSPLRAVSQRLADEPPSPHLHDLREYLRDVHDHVLRATERLSTVDELLTAAFSANAAQIGLRQNEDMRRISAWVGIIAVPTMIAGIYGMNFEHMPELEWRYGYFLVLGVILTVSVALYRAFKRSGWL